MANFGGKEFEITKEVSEVSRALNLILGDLWKSMEDGPLKERCYTIQNALNSIYTAGSRKDDKRLQEALDTLNKNSFQDFLKEKMPGEDKMSVYSYIIEKRGVKKEELDKHIQSMNDVFGYDIKVEELSPEAQEFTQKAEKSPGKILDGLHIRNYFFSLDDSKEGSQAKSKFMALGFFGTEYFGWGEKDVFDNAERDTFNDISNYYFNPLKLEKKKAVADQETFNKRIASLAHEVRVLNKRHGDYLESVELKDLLGEEGFKSDELKWKFSLQTCPEAVHAEAIRDHIKEMIDSGKIKEEYIKGYISEHDKAYNGQKLDVNELVEKFMATFDKQATPTASLNMETGGKTYRKFKEAEKAGSFNNFNILDPKQQRLLSEKAQEVMGNLRDNLKKQKQWADPAKDISLDSLRRLNNIYDQFSNTKKAIGFNSDEYKELREALNKAHEIYEKREANNKKGLSGKEKENLLKIYENVAVKALEYLDDKKTTRGTDSGEERYNIAFAALALTAKGEAKRLSGEHNIYREYKKVKKVTLKELMARSNMNYEDFKKEQKAAKKRAELENYASMMADIGREYGEKKNNKVLKNKNVLLPKK